MPKIIAQNLAADGYRVLVAEHRAKSIALLVHAPDLIVVDVNGPRDRTQHRERVGDHRRRNTRARHARRRLR
ncbi:MAG: hypothetical protein ACLP50_36215 [Solirubrobacteraceae bacterium]